MKKVTVITKVNGDIEQTVEFAGELLVYLNGVLQQQSKEWTEYTPPWKKWFAWRPVKDIHGQWHWWHTVYRKKGNTYVDHDDWTWYYYGTIFDVLKETNDSI